VGAVLLLFSFSAFCCSCTSAAADEGYKGNMLLFALLADVEESCGNFQRAKAHLEHLVSIDGLRVKYWTMRAQDMSARCQ
jgi:hypothetical protein